MKYWSVRPLGHLLLAVLLAAGMGLSVTQASGMAAKMATMSDMAMSDMGDCQACPDQTGNGAMKATGCGSMCAAPISLLPKAALVPTVDDPPSEESVDPLLIGRDLQPDPDPPRTSDIG